MTSPTNTPTSSPPTSPPTTTIESSTHYQAFFKRDNPQLFERTLRLRHLVFADEQQLPDWVVGDQLDDTVLHVAVVQESSGDVIATARIVPVPAPDDAATATTAGRLQAKIERVAVVKEARGRGVGASVMRAALNEARRRGYGGAVLDSETYATGFYQKLGFCAEGEEFMKVGLPHYIMRLQF